jgi:hypothetical protein
VTEAAPPHERHLASHIFNLTVLAIGGTALAWMLQRLGWDNARKIVLDVGLWFPVIVALDIGAMLCDAGAIHQFMRPEARMVSFWRVFAAQASGRAINILTPGGALGETTKVTMLITHAPRDRVISSIVLPRGRDHVDRRPDHPAPGRSPPPTRGHGVDQHRDPARARGRPRDHHPSRRARDRAR